MALIRVERAAGDLRSGVPVFVDFGDSAAVVMAAETAAVDRLAEIARAWPGDNPALLLSPNRASALKIRLYTPGAVAVPLEGGPQDWARIASIADPASDMDFPMRGPFLASRDPLPETIAAVFVLTKCAQLLPAAYMWMGDRARVRQIARRLELLEVTAQDLLAYGPRSARALELVTQASLPLAHAEAARVLAFRPPSGGREHLALLISAPSPDNPPLVRIHSECFTGDLLGSLKCDCGDQLRHAIQRMGTDPAGGVLLYMAQEGRGIGLINKLRAYRLQDQGFDTIEANTRLGFDPDERLFAAAAEILRKLGLTRIRLLTNNPAKIESLAAEGIEIAERVAHAFPANPHNENYIRTKAEKAGHLV
jgi:GTP cyclohydrolase II